MRIRSIFLSVVLGFNVVAAEKTKHEHADERIEQAKNLSVDEKVHHLRGFLVSFGEFW